MLRRHALPALLAPVWLAACGGPAPEPVTAPPQTDPGFVAAGDFELRYGTVAAAELPREVAASYGVERRPGVLVLSVSVLRREEGRLPAPVDATVRGSQRSLIGNPAALEFRELRAGGNPSWVAEVDPDAPGIVLIDIEAEPAAGGPRLLAKLKRDFPPR
jgi:hypothetical protein